MKQESLWLEGVSHIRILSWFPYFCIWYTTYYMQDHYLTVALWRWNTFRGFAKTNCWEGKISFQLLVCSIIIHELMSCKHFKTRCILQTITFDLINHYKVRNFHFLKQLKQLIYISIKINLKIFLNTFKYDLYLQILTIFASQILLSHKFKCCPLWNDLIQKFTFINI